MTAFDLLAVLLTVTALFAWLNARTVKLPAPIGVTLIALLASLGLLLTAGPGVIAWADGFLARLDFDELVLEGMLSVLLFAGAQLAAGLLLIPLVLLARLASVGVPIGLFRLRRDFLLYAIRTMTWGGLRGGISVALALSIPTGPERDLILSLTYAVAVFAILVQGLTVGRLAKRIPRGAD